MAASDDNSARSCASDPAAGPVPAPAVLLHLAQGLAVAVLVAAPDRRVTWLNDAACRLLGATSADFGRPARDLVPLDGTDANTFRRLREAVAAGQPFAGIVVNRDRHGVTRWLQMDMRPIPGGQGLVATFEDVSERLQQERRLAQAERMAAMGTLATGIAHEINTPVQYVSDSLHFLRDAAGDMGVAAAALQQVRVAVQSGAPAEPAAAAAAAAEDEADLPYLLEHVPAAIESCLDGITRVATLVRAIKEFAHPAQTTMTAVDLNHAVATTLTLARNEYKYVANLVTDFGELPPVRCLAGGINQVVLNLVVNAAHAIGAAVKGTGTKGTITVRTRCTGDVVEVAVSDTGGGVPDELGERIFEPFFTTKPVGQGTGQGLSLARSIVTRDHGGTLTCESRAGEGATFFVRLPVGGGRGARAAGVAA